MLPSERSKQQHQCYATAKMEHEGAYASRMREQFIEVSSSFFSVVLGILRTKKVRTLQARALFCSNLSSLCVRAQSVGMLLRDLNQL